MIHTLTLSPCIDLTLSVRNRLRLGEAQRLEAPLEFAGGKGVNVSCALHMLGLSTSAWVFLGGDRGKRWENLSKDLGIEIETVLVASETRQNIKIFEEGLSRQTDLNTPGPVFEEKAWSAFLDRLRNRLAPGDILVLAGSIFQDPPKDWAERLSQTVRSSGAKMVVDTSGTPLAQLAHTSPWAVKVNRLEFDEWQGADYPTLAGVADFLTEKGFDDCHLVVTDGSSGALGWSKRKEAFPVGAPAVQVGGTVGAGDAFTAGWLAGWLEKEGDWPHAMRMGAAVAAGAVELPGTSFPSIERVGEILRQIEIS